MEIEVTTEPHEFDLRHLGLNMREADIQEVYASSGEEPWVALQKSVDASLMSWLFFGDGKPLCAAGVSQITETIGCPWLLCASNIRDVPNEIFMACSHALMEEWSKHFVVLTNYVDSRNTVSERWLQNLGFEKKETEPYGFLQLPFTRYEYTRPQ